MFIAQAFSYAMSDKVDNRVLFTNCYGVGVASLLKGEFVAQYLIELKIGKKANMDKMKRSVTMLFDVSFMGVSIANRLVEHLIIAISKRDGEFFTQIQSYTYDVNRQIQDLKNLDGIDYYDYMIGEYLDTLLDD